MTKVLFFMAGEQPTELEAQALAALNAQRFDVEVRNSQLLIPGKPEACDAVVGSEDAIPSDYDTKPRFEGVVPPGGAVVTDGQALNVSNSAGDIFSTSALHVADGDAQWTNLPADTTLVKSGEVTGITVTGTGTKLTLTVAGGKITAASLSA